MRFLLNGGWIVEVRFVGINADGRRVFDDGGPLLVDGLDGEALEDR